MRWGLDCRVVNTIVCSLEGAYAFQGHFFRPFKGVLTPMHKTNGQGWLRTLQERGYRPGAWLHTMTCPVRSLISYSAFTLCGDWGKAGHYPVGTTLPIYLENVLDQPFSRLTCVHLAFFSRPEFPLLALGSPADCPC